jgi:hypothetical protein
MGKCRLEACKVLECGGYGVQALLGGVVDIAETSITLNTKTGLLARGAGSKVCLCVRDRESDGEREREREREREKERVTERQRVSVDICIC